MAARVYTTFFRIILNWVRAFYDPAPLPLELTFDWLQARSLFEPRIFVACGVAAKPPLILVHTAQCKLVLPQIAVINHNETS